MYYNEFGGNMDSNQVNYDFAKAWDLNQGDFAEGIAQNIINFASVHNRKIQTVYDVCCGASNLIGVFEAKGYKCFGTETRQGMYDYSKEKHPNTTYFLTKNMYDVPGKHKVDVITCTHDIVNYFENFAQWEEFFANVEKRLDKKGMFIFDFYTKHKLKDWNETTYKHTHHLDYLMNVKSGVYDKTVITYTYFINYDQYYIKTRDVVVESYFDNQTIFDALKKAGFKNIQIVDHNLAPVSGENLEYTDRIHVIAMKK